MKTIHIEGNGIWDETFRDAEQEEVLVLRDGRAVALVIPFDDDDVEWYARERDPAFLESIVVARREIEHGKSISHEELKREVGFE